ncbi:DNA-binding Lrp family transcriptional regulator [Rhizobium sp. BK313]|uniref:Lrp/AsnC family transcriptional regulator n=1 Tax=Rhizobium sp. BK313 TaxID=2587081 RepID=UPI00105EC707|nr:Lrp/AsnC family transcriptional regulator [Rhizobium sp. BK313]MBB3454602.1 DNA-binding Lrp family transcriptional regulator [Rhizobium sp. BK313]
MDEQLDKFDLRLLQELQKDGRLTNNELGERIALSPSQCSRRRTRLESEGYIRGYQANLDRQKLGLEMLVVISVTLATHNRDNAQRFSQLISGLPEVLEAYALTGEMDYHLKVATRGLNDLSRFVNDVLLPHESVQHVKTSIVLDTLKTFEGLPVLIPSSWHGDGAR